MEKAVSLTYDGIPPETTVRRFLQVKNFTSPCQPLFTHLHIRSVEASHLGYMFCQNKNVSITLKLRYICKKCCRIR